MSHKKDYTATLNNIEEGLQYDESSYSFVASVCDQYIQNGKISPKQLQALRKISRRIALSGPMTLPIAVPVLDEPGYLNINCKTGEVNFYSWQEFEKD